MTPRLTGRGMSCKQTTGDGSWSLDNRWVNGFTGREKKQLETIRSKSTDENAKEFVQRVEKSLWAGGNRSRVKSHRILIGWKVKPKCKKTKSSIQSQVRNATKRFLTHTESVEGNTSEAEKRSGSRNRNRDRSTQTGNRSNQSKSNNQFNPK